jgi:hypothetical protein
MGKGGAVIAGWIALGFFWLGALVWLGGLVRPAVGPLWLASAVALALVVAWWMFRARSDPRAIAALACWWFVASLFGPAALVLALPWFRGFRERSLGWIASATSADRAARRWQALLWHALAAVSWVIGCGGFLGVLFLPDNGPGPPSALGWTLFLIVPAVLWALAAGVVVRRAGSPLRSPGDAALLVSGAWWIASAIAAYALLFSV